MIQQHLCLKNNQILITFQASSFVSEVKDCIGAALPVKGIIQNTDQMASYVTFSYLHF